MGVLNSLPKADSMGVLNSLLWVSPIHCPRFTESPSQVHKVDRERFLDLDLPFRKAGTALRCRFALPHAYHQALHVGIVSRPQGLPCGEVGLLRNALPVTLFLRDVHPCNGPGEGEPWIKLYFEH